MSDSEMYIFVLRSAEGAFQGVYIAMFEFFGQVGSAGSILLIFVQKTAIFKRKALEYFTHEQWKLLSFPRVAAIVAPVHEGIFFH
jgi:hypothetical protein